MKEPGPSRWPPEDSPDFARVLDAALVEMAASATSEHWQWLREYIARRAAPLIESWMRPHCDAEDLTHAVLERLARPGKLARLLERWRDVAPDLPLPDYFDRYSRLMLRRTYKDKVLKHLPLKYVASGPHHADEEVAEDALEHLPAREPSVEEHVLTSERLDRVYAFLLEVAASGPDGAQRVKQFVLGAIHGVDHRRIGEQLGCDSDQIRGALFRLRASLERQFGREGLDTGLTDLTKTRQRRPPSQKRTRQLAARDTSASASPTASSEVGPTASRRKKASTKRESGARRTTKAPAVPPAISPPALAADAILVPLPPSDQSTPPVDTLESSPTTRDLAASPHAPIQSETPDMLRTPDGKGPVVP